MGFSKKKKKKSYNDNLISFLFLHRAYGWAPLQWNQLQSTKGQLQSSSYSNLSFDEHCGLQSHPHIYNINKALLTNRPVHFHFASLPVSTYIQAQFCEDLPIPVDRTKCLNLGPVLYSVLNGTQPKPLVIFSRLIAHDSFWWCSFHIVSFLERERESFKVATSS